VQGKGAGGAGEGSWRCRGRELEVQGKGAGGAKKRKLLDASKIPSHAETGIFCHSNPLNEWEAINVLAWQNSTVQYL
jgi:hypothetical protein